MKKWKHKQNSSFWFGRMDLEKKDIALMHRLPWKYLQKKGRYNVETCLGRIDCVKAFDRVKRDK